MARGALPRNTLNLGGTYPIANELQRGQQERVSQSQVFVDIQCKDFINMLHTKL